MTAHLHLVGADDFASHKAAVESAASYHETLPGPLKAKYRAQIDDLVNKIVDYDQDIALTPENEATYYTTTRSLANRARAVLKSMRADAAAYRQREAQAPAPAPGSRDNDADAGMPHAEDFVPAPAPEDVEWANRPENRPNGYAILAAQARPDLAMARPDGGISDGGLARSTPEGGGVPSWLWLVGGGALLLLIGYWLGGRRGGGSPPRLGGVTPPPSSSEALTQVARPRPTTPREGTIALSDSDLLTPAGRTRGRAPTLPSPTGGPPPKARRIEDYLPLVDPRDLTPPGGTKKR